ncbi:MAG: L-threonylcarbamoyladenylate synthase [Dehalococcoidales bacterium]|nr:L-threonylcarbamoyladenylate synthase [Dehalococcoidales bacterium]
MKDYHYAILASSLARGRKHMLYEPEVSLEKQLAKAVEILLSGGVVAYPTDTVYGLGAVYNNVTAIQRVYAIKGRSHIKALPLIVADYEQLDEITASINACGRLLMRSFWPGALTLVLPRSNRVTDDITGGADTIAARMPDHPVPLALARRTGRAICATSANISGQKSTIIARDVLKGLGSSVDYIISHGKTGCGIPSTLVDATAEVPVIIREGFITREQINRVCKSFWREE